MTGRALAAAALAIALAAAPAAAKFDPARRWRTTETPHFVVHFPDGCEELAARAALVAEEVHELLAPRVGWEPRARTRLVLSDDTDTAGGWATPYPYNQLLVSATPPAGAQGLATTRHDDWLRLVITHEYAHVLQLDLAAGLPLALRSVFGRLYFPNALQPEWLVEGLATFEETELTAGGRGRSPGAEMVLRMAALEGPFPTLDEMAVFPDRWPAGQVPYLFGESFIRHLAARHGREGVARVSRVYGGHPLPYFVETAALAALGTGYREPWREWAGGLRERFRGQERAVSAGGLTRSVPLTADGRFNGSPAWSPDGARVAWLRADGREFPGVWVMNADGTDRRRLAKSAFSTASSGATLAWSPDGRRLYYTKQGYLRGAALVNDLWARDGATGDEHRLTRGLRARDPAPSPDGRTLALVTAGGGTTRLALLDLDGPLPAETPSRLRFLTAASLEQLAEPRWSPDGALIAVSVRAGSDSFIRVLDAGSGATAAEIGRDAALDGSPAWSPDGGRLSFSSDRTGIFNIFAWERRNGAVSQVTNVLGGAFSPSPSPDGRRLAFADYGARGFDLRVMDLPPSPAAAAAPQLAGIAELRKSDSPGGPNSLVPPTGTGVVGSSGIGQAEGWRGGEVLHRAERSEHDGGPERQDPAALHGDQAISSELREGPTFASSPYSPLDTVLPRLWLPWFAATPASGTLYGFLTGGQDALQRHRYLASALYGPDEDRLMHLLDYAYDGLRPTLRAFSTDLDRTYAGLLEDARGAADYTERERALGVEATLAFPGLELSHAVSAGYRYAEASALQPLPPWPGYAGALPAQGSLGTFRVSWGLSSARQGSLAVSPGEGRTVLLALEHAQEGLGSDLTFTRASADWAEYLSLPWSRHVLQARLFAGGAGGDTPAQGAFSLGGDAPGDLALSVDDRFLRLRGYPLNVARGDQALLAGLEYRFPLLEIGRGGAAVPLFARRLHGALFVDAGNAWDGSGGPGGLLTGVGAELRLDLFFSYFAPVTLRLGIAVGLDEEGGVYPTLGLWMPQGLLGSATSKGRR